MSKPIKNHSVSIRLTDQIIEALDQRADTEQVDRTQIIRQAIEAYLDVSDNTLKQQIKKAIEDSQACRQDLEQQLKISETQSDRITTLETQLNQLTKIIGNKL